MRALQAALVRVADTHAHPTDTPGTLAHLPLAGDPAGTPSLRAVVAVSTCPTLDWDAVSSLATSRGRGVVPAFGVHPWRAPLDSLFASEHSPSGGPAVSESVVERLRTLLRRFPSAWVGEIGVDRAALDRVGPHGDGKPISGTPNTTNEKAGKIPLDRQLALFTTQLKVAAEMDRVATIHMVKYAGGLVDILNNPDAACPGLTIPRKVVLHSFGGKPETIRRILASQNGAKVYFSLSQLFNGRLDYFPEALEAIPADRILVETDENDAEMIAPRMQEIVQRIADIKGWTIDETAAQLESNFNALVNK